MNTKILSYGWLEGKNKLEFCPFCVQELENEGEDYKAKLKPLKWIRTAEPIQNKDGSYSNYIDTHYECGKCRNRKDTSCKSDNP